MNLRTHLLAAGWDGKERPDIIMIEAALEAGGIPFRRSFHHETPEGWVFEVAGQVVAKGAAIGLLEEAVWRWLNEANGL